MGIFAEIREAVYGQQRNTTTAQLSYETLRLAAAMGKKSRQELLDMLTLTSTALTKKDVARWRQAWQMALDIEQPRRTELYDIYSDVLIDLHLSGCIGQREGKTLMKSFILTDQSGKMDDKASKIFNAQWFFDFVQYALDSRYWGHSLIELGDVITDANGIMKFSDVKLVPRKHVMPEYGRILREQGDEWQKGVDYRTGAIADWCVEVGGDKDLGLLLKCAPQSLSKKNMLAYWDVFGEIFGMPLRVGKTNSQNAADLARIEASLKGMGAAAYALVPDGTEIEIKESTKSDAYKVYDMRVERANSEISKGILNQTMTIDNGSSLSQSQVHLEIFENVCKADQRLITNAVNDQLLPKMLKHGFPVKGLTFDWDNAVDYTPAEQRELERMLLDKYEIDPKYFIDKYKIDITAKRETSASFFE